LVATPTSTIPLELLAAQVDCELFSLPTGAHVFSRGASANAIYAVKRGIVELEGPTAERICYRPGELFSYQDIVWRQGEHRSNAVAQTPVEILRLDRLRFFDLLHNHPTLALLLIAQQHERLREQRTSGTCVY
jgi:CRP/FNR family transcriptional regulator, cyclic AMP receptor protein